MKNLNYYLKKISYKKLKTKLTRVPTILLNTKRRSHHLLRAQTATTVLLHRRQLLSRSPNATPALTHRIQIPQTSSSIGRRRPNQQVIVQTRALTAAIIQQIARYAHTAQVPNPIYKLKN